MSTNAQQQNVNYAAPSAQAVGSFTAPEGGGSQFTKTKLAVEPIPQGFHMCTIFAVVGIGTHSESFKGEAPSDKTKIFIAYEFPQFKRKFYAEDENLRSASIFQEMVFSTTSENGKLKKIIEAVCQRALTDDELKGFNCGSLISCSLIVNVTHKMNQKNEIKEQIVSYAPTNGFPVPMGYQPENEPWMFYLDSGFVNFRSEMFAKLPQFLKSKLIASKEGQSFINQGGVFAKIENDQNNNQGQNHQQNASQAQTQSPTPAPAPNQGVQQTAPSLQWLSTEWTYEQLRANNWSDQQLVDAGYAKWNQPTPAPAPTPTPSPTPTPAPTPAPAPVQNQQFQQQAQTQGFHPVETQPVQQNPATGFTNPAPTSNQYNQSSAPINQPNFLEDEDDDMPF